MSSTPPAAAKPIVVAITGASGVWYATRLLQLLCQGEPRVHLTVSPSGAAVIQQEMQFRFDLEKPDLSAFLQRMPPWSDSSTRSAQAKAAAELAVERIDYHHYQDYMTPIASGSFRTAAMVICPCSGSTLSGIARAAGSNLIQRAAEVHLKEHRKLILVPRETPLSALQLENMQKLAAAGAVMLPAMPGWYHGVNSLDDLIDFVVSRVLDQLDVGNALIQRWGESP